MSNRQSFDLKIHPGYLVSLIKAQADSIGKALLEGMKNSLDAGATRIVVSLTSESFSILDNGRGFASDQEVRELFGQFGAPRVEGDVPEGRFRTGRAAMMALAKTIWRSGYYRLDLDIEAEGLTYQQTRLDAYEKGCKIVGLFYQPLSSWKLAEALRDLKALVAFSPASVHVNGELCGRNPAEFDDWTHQDDDAYYRIEQGVRTLRVYNRGVLVEELPSWYAGKGGVVVSKKALSVNDERDSVDQKGCPVWARIHKTLGNLTLTNLLGAKLDTEVRKRATRA